ncbi:MAG TPA: ribosome maturation factor RimM [Anaerolineaceae bacterium]|nr:ribosome maturation factor RimM [Anaerolineaceae bacterium]
MVPNNSPRGDDQETGSPPQGEPVYLAVGRLRRPHGIKGEIVMDVMTDFPERLRRGKRVYVGDNHQPMTLAGLRQHQNALLVSFRGIDTPEAIGDLRNQYVFILAADLPPLPEGEYYHHELLGMTLVDESGRVLGILEEILETGANDVYLVRTPEGGELLVPAIADVILEVNLDERKIRVRLQEYL